MEPLDDIAEVAPEQDGVAPNQRLDERRVVVRVELALSDRRPGTEEDEDVQGA